MMLSPFLSSAKVGSSSSFCNENTVANVGDDYFALNIQLSLSSDAKLVTSACMVHTKIISIIYENLGV